MVINVQNSAPDGSSSAALSLNKKRKDSTSKKSERETQFNNQETSPGVLNQNNSTGKTFPNNNNNLLQVPLKASLK